ncbi:DeoR/GlpR family DNA-binding transcription regulator [Saxibacter everestensis]|uniref:Lactose phosphotransferase system repressor n=1 Tax=Saxibacter everestensis TaxID=2909229 RepID=A0ABY8QT65_9MICO|nr:DeoR/GlpR family DNA-binding transcription regulator [Brevibacteriaceae bacterium ZFBP1038]
MLRDQRHDELIRALTQHGAMAIKDVAAVLGVSEATARRDIGLLADDGRLTRVYGGAAIKAPNEVPFAYAEYTDHGEKQLMAQAASDLVSDGDTLILDIGTTMLEVARALSGRPVTIITSNMAVYEILKQDSKTELLFLGGLLRRNYHSTVGFLTENALRQVHADLAFLGTSGVTRRGQVVDTTPVEVSIKQQMLLAADRAVLVATARKFPGRGHGVVCEAERISTLVTSTETDQAYFEPFADSGTEVITA